MEVRCLDDFKNEYTKLRKNNSYKSISYDIINHFFDKSYEELCNGSRLNGSSTNPYIKKRLKGAGGFRVYFLLVIKNDAVYLMFVHPKTGSQGAENITPDFKATLLKKMHDCLVSKNFYSVSLNDKKDDLIFTPFEPKSVTDNPIPFKAVAVQA